MTDATRSGLAVMTTEDSAGLAVVTVVGEPGWVWCSAAPRLAGCLS